MILLDVKREIRARGAVSLADLSRRLGSDPATLRPMVEHWIRRGQVRRLDLGCDSCGCPHCGPMGEADKEIYASTAALPEAGAVCAACRPR